MNLRTSVYHSIIHVFKEFQARSGDITADTILPKPVLTFRYGVLLSRPDCLFQDLVHVHFPIEKAIGQTTGITRPSMIRNKTITFDLRAGLSYIERFLGDSQETHYDHFRD